MHFSRVGGLELRLGGLGNRFAGLTKKWVDCTGSGMAAWAGHRFNPNTNPPCQHVAPPGEVEASVTASPKEAQRVTTCDHFDCTQVGTMQFTVTFLWETKARDRVWQEREGGWFCGLTPHI